MKQHAALPPASEVPLDTAAIERVIRRSTSDYEPRFGGFGHAPKFPRQTLLKLLLTLLEGCDAADPERDHVATMLRHTLDAMANGGIRDQLGGGFHRYSTDAKWLVPHFEIMLYDQAMLAPVYARAARVLDEPRYARVARGICDFVLREMTGTSGEFYTAFDAEVDHQEGLNYLWTTKQIEDVLGAQDAATFNAVYGLATGPNFADPHHSNGIPDQNILHLPDGPAHENEDAIIAMREKLHLARGARKQPLLDTKIITGWNALMIEALAVVSRELSEPAYKTAAARCVDFLLREHVRPDGSLYRVSRDGVKKYDGFLDDYAGFALALLELHTTSRDVRWKAQAETLAIHFKRLFGDGAVDSAGFHFTAAGASELLVRQKTSTDSPLPSGNALAALALHQLGQSSAAQSVIDAFSRSIQDYGESMSSLVEAALLIDRRRNVSDSTTAVSAAYAAPRIVGSGSVVILSASRVGDRRIEAHVVIDPCYHVHDTNTDPQLGLHATRLRVDARHATLVDFIDYPPAQLLQLPFGPPMMAYTGNVTISVTFAGPMPDEPIELSLSYQACDETTCLRPAIATAIV